MSDASNWQLPIGHSHHRAASAGALTFVGGAGDFDAAGAIRNPDDLDRQIDGAMANLAVSVRSGRGMGAVKRISYVEARPHKVLSFCW